MKSCAALLGLLLLSSCATVLRGTHDKLRVESEPSGADVALSSGESGITPVTFIKKRTDQFLVTIKKTGYQTRSVAVQSKFSASGGAAVLGNAIAGGLVGAIVDGSTGATKSLYPNPISVGLIPNGKLTPTSRKSLVMKSPPVAKRALPESLVRRQTVPPSVPQKTKASAPRFRTDKYGTQYLDSGR